ncbi:PD40 domain-containing protein [bacterium]|nr:PD40 domain-containing protein [bacterium]
MLRKSLLAVVLVTLCLSSQSPGDILRVTDEPTQLTPQGQYFMHPLWSPSGDRLILAGRNYQGLWSMDRRGGEPQQICDRLGAGFGPTWSPDGQRIACRVSQMQEKRKLSAIAVYDLDKGTATELTDYRKDLGLPQWIDRGRKLFFISDGQSEMMEAPGATPAEVAGEDLLLYLRDGAMVAHICPGDEKNVLRPVEQEILWAVLSPDKKHIAFQALGARLYVVGIDGSDLVDLGRGERPRWSPDGQWITYMITEDDGHRILSSDIYAIRQDGTGKVAVTQTPDRLEMNPDWSPDGGMLACDTRGEGVILLIPVKTEREDYPPMR